MKIGYALMTIAILQFTFIPLAADFNRTHATNPAWPGHARFHVVSQVTTTSLLGGLALFFLWSARVDAQLGICIAMMLGLVALGGFFVSVLATPLYGGHVAARGATAARNIDGNVANFGLSLALLVAGRLMIA